MTCILGWETPCFALGHCTNTTTTSATEIKSPDVTGIYCLNTLFMSFPSKGMGGSDFSFLHPIHVTPSSV